jgi:hypothetical protein
MSSDDQSDESRSTSNEQDTRDPVLALATPSDDPEADDCDIFQFFAGPSSSSISARSSMATAVGDGDSLAKVKIAEGSIKACTSPRVRRKTLPKVDEDIDGEQHEKWFSTVESML